MLSIAVAPSAGLFPAAEKCSCFKLILPVSCIAKISQAKLATVESQVPHEAVHVLLE
jgi:hypothetical protein